jgi:serine/threonine protein kinase
MKPGRMLNTWCGSPIYAAPEIVMRNTYIGPKADVWALGVILFGLATGCMPWRCDDDGSVVHMEEFCAGIFKFPRNCVLSASLKDLIFQMLQPDPEKRIGIAEIKQHPWVVKNRGPLSPFL